MGALFIQYLAESIDRTYASSRLDSRYFAQFLAPYRMLWTVVAAFAALESLVPVLAVRVGGYLLTVGRVLLAAWPSGSADFALALCRDG